MINKLVLPINLSLLCACFPSKTLRQLDECRRPCFWQPKGCSNNVLLTIEDLLVAYRKAKADCFFENTFPTAIKFAEYEQDLLVNLNDLLRRLKSNSGFEGDEDLLGDFRLLPKKLSTYRKSESNENGHVHFSKPERSVESLFKNYDITPEFRIVGDFPVDTHIISALWINMIGHQFDAKLDNSCYGARLKRIRNDELFAEDDEKPFHISSIGSFVPYFQPYQKWCEAMV